MIEVDWDRDRKAQAREIALACVNGPKRNVLMLPGKQARCVEKAVKLGTFDEHTKGVFVEQDPDVFPLMKKAVQKVGLKGIFLQADLTDVVFLKPIDYAFFDFCGSINDATARWMMEQAVGNLAPSAELAFTFAMPFRSNDFIKTMSHIVDGNDEAKAYINTLATEYGICNDEQNHRILFFVAILKALLYPFDFDLLSPPVWYYDIRVPMTLLVVGNMRPNCSRMGAWLHQELKNIVIPKRQMSAQRVRVPFARHRRDRPNPVMVLAGYKSWETRRRNSLKKGGKACHAPPQPAKRGRLAAQMPFR
jgi:hypothetical protein